MLSCSFKNKIYFLSPDLSISFWLVGGFGGKECLSHDGTKGGLTMAALALNGASKMMLQENSSMIGRYTRSAIEELTYNFEPFLITGEALLFGNSHSQNDFTKVMTISTVSEEDCAGHFGPKVPSGQAHLKIPLLHLSRSMAIASQIAARLIDIEAIPVLVGGTNVRANNQNLISPPSTIVAIATDFDIKDEDFVAQTFARANGEPYAQINDLAFKLVPVSEFNRQHDVKTDISDKLLDGYKIRAEMYRSEIEELILERAPFHRLDRALVMESSKGDLRILTMSKVAENDCDGQLKIDGMSSLSLVDYARIMALTAEILASMVTKERFDGFNVVPLAVKVDKVTTPNLQFFSPPTTVVAVADISAKNLHNPRLIKRGKQLFRADTTSVWIDESEVARMERVLYALVPENEFFKM